jgi:peptide/nickel transport system substrate-binding protein
LYWLCPDSKNADSPFANLKVREAVEYAIDKETIVKTFGYGFNEALYQMVSPGMPLAYVPTLAPRKYDPTTAKQLLADAGYSNGFDTTIFAQTIDDKDLLTAIKGYLDVVGIRTKIDILEPASFMERHKKGWTNGLVYYQYAAGALPPLLTYNWFFSINSTSIISLYRPVSMTDALKQARIEPNPEKYKELMQSITKTLYDEALMVPLWTYPGIVATNKSVHDLDMFRLDKTLWSATDTWLSK